MIFDQEKLLKRETHGFLRQTKQLGISVFDLMFLLVSSQNVAPFLSHFWMRDEFHGKLSSYGGSPILIGNP